MSDEPLADRELSLIETIAREEGRPEVFGDDALRMVAEIRRLRVRQAELLELAAKLTRETPYPAEIDDCRSARAALIAEVSTLRAENEQLRRRLG